MHRTIAGILAVLKWPAAIFSVAYFPASLWALCAEMALDIHVRSTFLPLAIGVLSYFLVWNVWLRHSNLTWLSTLEHELVHAIFALLTGNRPVSLRVTLRSGGLFQYRGSPNFLIAVSPYFTPLGTIVVLAATAFVTVKYLWFRYAAVGVTLGFHVTSTLNEVHAGQTDLRDDTGLLFAFLFLPTANAVSLALVFADLRAHWHGMAQLLLSVRDAPCNPLHLWDGLRR